jgi:F-type H+-transporting ATPase subunit a
LDHPWGGVFTLHIGGMGITWMSSAIATMVLVAILLMLVLPWMARKRIEDPSSAAGSFVEVIVLFVRNQIAVPAMGEQKAYRFLPFLLTLFIFVLGMNYFGMLPVAALTNYFLPDYPMGATPTAVLSVCATLALMTLVVIFVLGLWKAAEHQMHHSRWPIWLALPLSPVLWFLRLSPPIPGMIGKVLLIPLAILEFTGVVAKCFALMIRIFANMLAGHIMLAVIMMFIVQTLVSTYQTAMDPAQENSIAFFYVGPLCVVGSVLVDLMELLVAGLQAYIYTFLTAIFIGLYAEPAH